MKPTAYISGHLDLTPVEWLEHYHKRVLAAVIAGHDFVVGDAIGADLLGQRMLQTVALPGVNKVIVYHMGYYPRNNASPAGHPFTLFGGFRSDNERDTMMTQCSTYDIAWVRTGREKSGTARNLKRRIRFTPDPTEFFRHFEGSAMIDIVEPPEKVAFEIAWSKFERDNFIGDFERHLWEKTQEGKRQHPRVRFDTVFEGYVDPRTGERVVRQLSRIEQLALIREID